MLKNWQKTAVISILALGSAAAFADNITARCTEDQLNAADAAGRNAWARRCGYIRPSTEAAYNEEGSYLIFTAGKKGGSPDIPVVESAPCISGLTKLGACMAGCYTPSQHLDFDGALSAIEEGFRSELRSVTALTADSQVGQLRFAPQPIQSFVMGQTDETIYILSADNGRRLEVTAEHPMVDATGLVVKAKNLRVGDRLMTAAGQSTRIVSLEQRMYHGAVWNVQPRSRNQSENILVAEGFLTGSVRFQNEWADDLFRISLRHELDASGI